MSYTAPRWRARSIPSQIAYPVIGGTAYGCLRWYVVPDIWPLINLLNVPQVDARISIFRGEVRSVASAAIASYGIIDPDQAGEYLLQGLTYIYPIDPAVSFSPLLSLKFSLIIFTDQEASRRQTIPPPGHRDNHPSCLLQSQGWRRPSRTLWIISPRIGRAGGPNPHGCIVCHRSKRYTFISPHGM